MSYSFSENQWGEKYIEELNRTDFVGMKSSEFFDRVLDYDLERENTLYLVIGSDSGLLLSYLKQLSLGRGSRVAVIEHDDVYPLVAAEYRGLLSGEASTTSTVKNPITLHKHSQWHDEIFDGSEKPWLLGGQVRVVESHASTTDYVHIYMPVLRATKEAAKARVANISVTLNRSVFTQMQFRNAPDNNTPLKISTEFGAGKTAVVLGGGPSLDQHLNWVQANRDKLFILAVSRIANKLIKLELKPDLLVSVDPFEFSYQICKPGLIWTDVPLVYNFHVSPKLLQQWQGATYYLGKRLPWHGSTQLQGNVAAAGPTVSHAAVFAASQLGFSQILMSGVDLCYSASATTHANDSPERMIQQMPSLCDARTETYSGRIAGTVIGMFQSIEPLDTIGKLINRHKPILFNMSEEAARCASIPYKSVDDVVLPETKPDFSTYLSLEPQLPSLEELDQLDTELKRARHAFKKMRTLCSEAKTLVKKVHTPGTGNIAQKSSIKLSKVRKRIENEYPEYLEAVIYDNGVAFNKAQTPTAFEDMTVDELVEWGSHYYNLIDQGARNMIDRIDSLNIRITLRRDEHDPDINIRHLAKRWREDETPGRILLWKRLKWRQIKAEDRAWVQRAIGKFRSTLNEPAALVKDALSRHNQDINHVMKSLVFLSENQKKEELQAIESNLSATQWPYSALKSFTAGLLLDLHKETSAALISFQQAIDQCSERLITDKDSLTSMHRLIEESLVRMTQCYIGEKDYQSSLTTLGMLCEMLPSYVVSYAKMLNLCGQEKFAIELLESYLQLYPGNKKALFALDNIRPQKQADITAVENPAYVEKISGAMQAIMGAKTEQAG